MKKEKIKKPHKVRDLSVYIVLRTLVIITMILQIVHKNWNDVFLCILTLFLLMIPSILDKKLNCFRVFEGNKVNKGNELTFRYAINSKRVEAFNNKDSKYLLTSTVNNDKCFGPYKFEDGEFILA